MAIGAHEILAKLFGSASRVKIIRLFLLNPNEVFSGTEISQRAKVAKDASRREISVLRTAGFIIPKREYAATAAKNKKGKLRHPDREARRGSESRPRRLAGKKIQGWKLNGLFPLINSLKNFVLNTAPISRSQLLKKLQKSGRLKLVILSGIFGKGDPGRVDIFVVGDGLKKGVLERAIRDIEAEIGKELTYAVLSTDDFFYRLGMYDKFIRDILDYPHEKILDKLNL